MTSSAISDYLAKEVTVNRKIVTFRLLSRRFVIHVNEAKRELLSFLNYARSISEPVFATYLVSGEVLATLSPPSTQEDNMDTDELEDDSDDKIFQEKQVLVGEQELATAKSTFASIYSCHVYCLSPAPLIDADLICEPTQEVRKIDVERGRDFEISVGKVVSPDVKFIDPKGKGSLTSKSTAGGSLARLIAPSKTTSKDTSIKGTTDEISASQKPTFKPAPEKPKPSTQKAPPAGTLDWSKAKTKASSKDPAVDTTTKDEENLNKLGEPSSKRGVKRKSEVVSTPGSQNTTELDTPPKSVSTPTLAANWPQPSSVQVTLAQSEHVISGNEDEEDGGAIRKPGMRTFRRRSRIATPPPIIDKGLQAMMDVDDDMVTKAPRPSARSQQIESEEEEEASNTLKKDDISTGKPSAIPSTDPDGDVHMDSDSDPAPKAKSRKRKEKKTVPKGRNGKPKKAVKKSREFISEDGYMVTEDYTSYESAPDEADEAEGASRPATTEKETSTLGSQQSKVQATKKTERNNSLRPSKTPSTTKSTAGKKATSQANLMANYFKGTQKG